MATSPTLDLRAKEVAALEKSEEGAKFHWEGLLPVCSWCQKIRDPDGEWLSFEEFFLKYFEVGFTYTICEDCRDRHCPDFPENCRH